MANQKPNPIITPTVVDIYPWYGDRPRDPEFEDWEYAHEEWREVVGEPGYWVSNLGRVISEGTPEQRDGDGEIVKRAKPRRVLRWSFSGSKKVYPVVSIRRRSYLVHVLVAEAFLGPRPKGYEIDHLDGNAFNARVTNLAYVTSAQNVRSRVERYEARGVKRLRLPLQPDGYCSHGHKLTKEDLSVPSGCVCHECLKNIYQRNKKQVRSFIGKFNEGQTAMPVVLPHEIGDPDQLTLDLRLTQDDEDVISLFDWFDADGEDDGDAGLVAA